MLFSILFFKKDIVLFKDWFLEISKNNCGDHVTQAIIDAAQSEDISNHELELAFDP